MQRLERARVHLAVGHVVDARPRAPAPALDSHAEVGVGADDADLARLGERVRAAGEAHRARPSSERRDPRALDVAGAEDEVLVLARATSRPPARARASARAMPHQRSSPAATRSQRRFASLRCVAIRRWWRSGSDPGERAGVLLRPDRDDRVHELDLAPRRSARGTRAAPRSPRRAGAREAARARRSCTGALRRRGPRGRARPRAAPRPAAVDPEDLARLEPERVRDDQLGQPLDSRVSHLREALHAEGFAGENGRCAVGSWSRPSGSRRRTCPA